MTASIVPCRRSTRGHGLTANVLERPALGSQFLPGGWHTDAPTGGEDHDASRVWLRRARMDQLIFPAIGCAGIGSIINPLVA